MEFPAQDSHGAAEHGTPTTPVSGEHRFVGGLDVLAIGLELREVPVDERCPARRYLLEVPVSRDTYCVPGEAYCHSVWDLLGLSDQVDLM